MSELMTEKQTLVQKGKSSMLKRTPVVQAFLRLQLLFEQEAELPRKPFERPAFQRVGEFLSPWLHKIWINMRACCSALGFMEWSLAGVGECARVGDRFLSTVQQCLGKWLRDNLIEGLRSGIQTSFYTCDYTTKPALTCGPVLRHLTVGMQRLEEKMKIEAETLEFQRVMQCPEPRTTTTPAMSPEAQEARKRLCRLWTSANHAVMHGHCLMAIHMLTGREVIRTHVFWRLMLKRVVWGVFQQIGSQRDGGNEVGEIQVPLTDVAMAVASSDRKETGERVTAVDSTLAVGSPSESRADLNPERGKAVDSTLAAGSPSESRADLNPENTGSLELRTTSFYEDYLHRGEEEPLKSMNFYVYGMHVSCVHIQQVGNRMSHVAEFDFAPHYGKSKFYVQVLHQAPRVPYLHGITMPTKEKDPEMWAAVHIGLLRAHKCLGSEKCGQAAGVQHLRKIPTRRRHRIAVAGTDVRRLEDKTRVLAEWRATEAEMQTLADRADVFGLQLLFCLNFSCIFPLEAFCMSSFFVLRNLADICVFCCDAFWHVRSSCPKRFAFHVEVKLRLAKRCPTVVDTAAVREFTVPGVQHRSETLQFLVGLFRRLQATFGEMSSSMPCDRQEKSCEVLCGASFQSACAAKHFGLCRCSRGWRPGGYNDRQYTWTFCSHWRRTWPWGPSAKVFIRLASGTIVFCRVRCSDFPRGECKFGFDVGSSQTSSTSTDASHWRRWTTRFGFACRVCGGAG